MQKVIFPSTILVAFLAFIFIVRPAFADEEASNFAHLVADPRGRCYAKSVPRYAYDPKDGPRQQGHTEVYRVGDPEDVLVQRYHWFSQNIFIDCRSGAEPTVVRVGPLQRGHEPRADHLALAFYRGGELIRRYSTLDNLEGKKVNPDACSKCRNVSLSLSHYTVFSHPPWIADSTTVGDGPFKEIITAITIDGRVFEFDLESGELLGSGMPVP